MPALYVALTSSHRVFYKRWTNSTPLIVMNSLIHQEIGKTNLHNLTSNPVHILFILLFCTGLRIDWYTIVLLLGMLFHFWGLQVFWLDSNLPRAVYLPLLDSGWPIVLYNKEHTDADVEYDIIHAYVQLLQIQIQKSDSKSYS